MPEDVKLQSLEFKYIKKTIASVKVTLTHGFESVEIKNEESEEFLDYRKDKVVHFNDGPQTVRKVQCTKGERVQAL